MSANTINLTFSMLRVTQQHDALTTVHSEATIGCVSIEFSFPVVIGRSQKELDIEISMGLLLQLPCNLTSYASLFMKLDSDSLGQFLLYSLTQNKTCRPPSLTI